MKKILTGLILLNVILFGTADSTKNEFAADNPTDKSFVKDSELTKDSYSRGIYYNVNLGEKTRIKTYNQESGEITIKDQDGNIVKSGQENNLSEIYRKALDSSLYQTDENGVQKYLGGFNESLETSPFYSLSESQKAALKEKKKQALDNAKKERDNELKLKGRTQTNKEEIFLKGLSPQGKGQRAVNNFISEHDGVRDSQGRLINDDKNTTDFYRASLGYSAKDNSKERIQESKSFAFKKATEQIEQLEELIRSQTESKQIQCFISRDLIEAYYCPISDRNDILFPDYLNGGATIDDAQHYSSKESKDTCQKTCKQYQGCKGLKVQEDKSKNITSYSNNIIYPTRNPSNGEFILNVSKKVQTKEIQFDVVIRPSNSFDGNATAFDEFLRKRANHLKMNLSLVKNPTDDNSLTESISSFETKILNHSTIRVILPVYRQSDRFVLKLFKPFLYPENVQTYERIGETDFFNKIQDIRISNLKAIYTNNEVFFCPTRQIIYNLKDCKTGQVLHISQNNQNFNVCLDDDHKIGDDSITGGFFNEDSCEINCYDSEECLPTYRHYSDLSKRKVYKTSIGCVKDDSNIGCQDQFCESLISDHSIEPLNEITINSKDERVYTVKNFLKTDVPRPKIDLVSEEEASTDEDYDAIFQKEMKDSAYLNMIDNQTFNRLKYKIGEESPEQKAYLSDVSPIGTAFKGLIKHAANRYDDNLKYRIYSVIELETQYRLRFGQFIIKNPSGMGNTILDANKTSVIVTETTYLINNNGTWNIFKKKFKNKLKQNKKVLSCPKNSGGESFSSTGKLTQQDKNNGCYMRTVIYWTNLTNYRSEKFVKYINNKLVRFAKTTKAPYIVNEEILSNSEIKEYLITNSIEHLVRDTPGALIRDQITEDDGRTTTEIYDMARPLKRENMSQIKNYKIYMFTGERDISFENIINYKLTDKNLLFEKENQSHGKVNIYDDGEIGNGIKPFMLGTKSKQSFILDLKPKFDEVGKKVFQFMFLYNERGVSSPN